MYLYGHIHYNCYTLAHTTALYGQYSVWLCLNTYLANFYRNKERWQIDMDRDRVEHKMAV